MLALAETATFHEVPLLRDAIWKHLAGRTSLKVGIPVSYYICDISTGFSDAWLGADFLWSRARDIESSS
jgi:hypothetical protein